MICFFHDWTLHTSSTMVNIFKYTQNGPNIYQQMKHSMKKVKSTKTSSLKTQQIKFLQASIL